MKKSTWERIGFALPVPLEPFDFSFGGGVVVVVVVVLPSFW